MVELHCSCKSLYGSHSVVRRACACIKRNAHLNCAAACVIRPGSHMLPRVKQTLPGGEVRKCTSWGHL